MSRTPNSRKEDTHQRILDVAARAIRSQGYAGVGVADGGPHHQELEVDREDVAMKPWAE